MEKRRQTVIDTPAVNPGLIVVSRKAEEIGGPHLDTCMQSCSTVL